MQGDLKDQELMGMGPRAVEEIFDYYKGQLGETDDDDSDEGSELLIEEDDM